MKMQRSQKQTGISYVLFFIVFVICGMAMKSPLYAAPFWELHNLDSLIGKGQFIVYQRNVETKDPLFPLEVLNDGFKMVRVYESFPGIYMVEWAWRATLKNKSSRPVEITFEYKLQDQDTFLVASSKEYFKKIGVGETVTIEKIDNIPYETAKRVMNTNWYIYLQN